MKKVLVFSLQLLGISACSFQGGLNQTLSNGVAIKNIITGSGIAYVAYHVIDPQAPAWSIKEELQEQNQVSFFLKMQLVRPGGQGEAQQVLQRRIDALVKEGGFAGYELLYFSEGIEQGFPLSARVAYAKIKLSGDSFSAGQRQ